MLTMEVQLIFPFPLAWWSGVKQVRVHFCRTRLSSKFSFGHPKVVTLFLHLSIPVSAKTQVRVLFPQCTNDLFGLFFLSIQLFHCCSLNQTQGMQEACLQIPKQMPSWIFVVVCVLANKRLTYLLKNYDLLKNWPFMVQACFSCLN